MCEPVYLKRPEQAHLQTQKADWVPGLGGSAAWYQGLLSGRWKRSGTREGDGCTTL